MPPSDQSGRTGWLTDKFGVNLMVSILRRSHRDAARQGLGRRLLVALFARGARVGGGI
jgi:hypothetical protein